METENSEALVVVRATSDDVPAILYLCKKLFTYEIENEFDVNLNPLWAETEEAHTDIRERISSNDSCGFVVKKDNTVIVYLVGNILTEETGRIASKYAEIEHMFVESEFRGAGLGEKLVDAFKEWAVEKGLTRIKVTASSENKKAINFYKK